MSRASIAAAAFLTLIVAGLGCESTVLVTPCSDGECGGEGEGAGGPGPTATSSTSKSSTTATTTTGNPCEGNLSFCDGQCVDTSTSTSHCGGCFQPCDSEQLCISGICQTTGCEDGGICGICQTAFLPSNVPQSIVGTNEGAQNNFVPFCTGTSIPEVQHIFTAPTAGAYQFDTVGSAFDTSLSLLDPFGCFETQCDDEAFDFAAVLVRPMQAGETVHVVVDGFQIGTYQLNISLVDQCMGNLTSCNGDCVDTLSDPDHCGFCDNPCGPNEVCQMGFCQSTCNGPCGTCSAPTVLAGIVPQTVSGNTTGAPDHLVPSCTGQLGPEHYYQFTAPSAGSYVFSTANSAYDTVLTVLDSASCGELGCNDNFGGPTSRVTATLAQGQTVYVIVDGKNTSGQYNLLINVTPTPTCPLADLGSVSAVTVSGNTQGGTSSFTPSCVPSSTAPDHAYTFTAPATAVYEMNTFGSSYDTVLSVLGATCAGASLACDDDTPGMGTVSQLFVNLAAGQTVTVVVDGWASGAGNYILNIIQQ